eukprot:jgi/Psemu1/44931/gm1.44931_g
MATAVVLLAGLFVWFEFEFEFGFELELKPNFLTVGRNRNGNRKLSLNRGSGGTTGASSSRIRTHNALAFSPRPVSFHGVSLQPYRSATRANTPFCTTCDTNVSPAPSVWRLLARDEKNDSENDDEAATGSTTEVGAESLLQLQVPPKNEPRGGLPRNSTNTDTTSDGDAVGVGVGVGDSAAAAAAEPATAVPSSPPNSLWKQAKNEDVDLLQLAKSKSQKEQKQKQENNALDRASSAVLGAIALVQELPAKVEESIEQTQQLLEAVEETVEETIEQTKQLPSRVRRSVEETIETVEQTVEQTIQTVEQTVEQTIETTQNTVRTVQEFPGQVTRSVEETQRSVEETIETTQRTIQNVRDFPSNVVQSVEDTRHDVGVFLGLEQPNVRKKMEPPTVPMTIEEGVVDLAGKATTATVRAVVWTGMGVGSLAWKGAKNAYNTTIGPVVNDSINATTRAIQDIPSAITPALPRPDTAKPKPKAKPPGEKARPRKSQSPVVTSKRTRPEPARTDAPQPPPIAKSPSELQKELVDAQTLVREISEALDAAERAMNLAPNNELDDPMIDIGKLQQRQLAAASDATEPNQPATKRALPFWKKRPGKKGDAASELLAARIQRAKTKEHRDAEQELANEIADALAIAEQALSSANDDETTNSNVNGDSNGEPKGNDESSTTERKTIP